MTTEPGTDALRLLADLFSESAHETWAKEEIVSIIEDAIRLRVQPQTPREPTREQLLSVLEAAYGLCHGYDWNCGTAAIAAGYRRKLLSAVNAIKEVPDFEGKYRDYGPVSRPDRNTK